MYFSFLKRLEIINSRTFPTDVTIVDTRRFSKWWKHFNYIFSYNFASMMVNFSMVRYVLSQLVWPISGFGMLCIVLFNVVCFIQRRCLSLVVLFSGSSLVKFCPPWWILWKLLANIQVLPGLLQEGFYKANHVPKPARFIQAESKRSKFVSDHLRSISILVWD